MEFIYKAPINRIIDTKIASNHVNAFLSQNSQAQFSDFLKFFLILRSLMTLKFLPFLKIFFQILSDLRFI